MRRMFRVLFFRIYIHWLAMRWIPHINLGDEVIHRRRCRLVLNGASPDSWTLSNPWQEWVPRKECRKHWTVANCWHSYRAGVLFYRGYWLSILAERGFQPWIKALPIWPWSRSRGEKQP